MIASKDVSAGSPLPRGVRRVLDAMRGNVGRDWRLAELAAIAGVSGRTLQRQFLAFAGKTPRAVLREMWPYYVPLLVTLALITFIPAITTWVPRLAIGN